jgi:hypothetical protein
VDLQLVQSKDEIRKSCLRADFDFDFHLCGGSSYGRN